MCKDAHQKSVYIDASTCVRVPQIPGEEGVDLDQVHLPDPVDLEISRLRERLTALEEAVKTLSDKAN